MSPLVVSPLFWLDMKHPLPDPDHVIPAPDLYSQCFLRPTGMNEFHFFFVVQWIFCTIFNLVW